jgi:hypothetical protein
MVVNGTSLYLTANQPKACMFLSMLHPGLGLVNYGNFARIPDFLLIFSNWDFWEKPVNFGKVTGNV